MAEPSVVNVPMLMPAKAPELAVRTTVVAARVNRIIGFIGNAYTVGINRRDCRTIQVKCRQENDHSPESRMLNRQSVSFGSPKGRSVVVSEGTCPRFGLA